MMTARRANSFLLADPERRLLRWLAVRMPSWVTSDRLSILGVIGAVGTGLGYALSGWNPAWLWFASAMLVVNWFGDSLDGTLARVRRLERPNYGYYLDHILDALSTAIVGVGIGLSPLVSFEMALAAVVIYLILAINVYLETTALGVFDLAYGIMGPTEGRIVMVGLNAVAFVAATTIGIGPSLVLVANIAVAILIAGMLGLLGVRVGKNLRVLAEREPARRRSGELPAATTA